MLYQELDQVVVQSGIKLTQTYNRTAFNAVFGDLLLECSRLPMRDIGRNFVLKAVVEYLQGVVSKNPREVHANIADLLLSLNEVSALLSTSYEQVYRLYQEGYLPLGYRPFSMTKLAAGTPAFHLRNVIELKLAKMQSQKDFNQIYFPAW